MLAPGPRSVREQKRCGPWADPAERQRGRRPRAVSRTRGDLVTADLDPAERRLPPRAASAGARASGKVSSLTYVDTPCDIGRPAALVDQQGRQSMNIPPPKSSLFSRPVRPSHAGRACRRLQLIISLMHPPFRVFSPDAARTFIVSANCYRNQQQKACRTAIFERACCATAYILVQVGWKADEKIRHGHGW